MKIMAKEVEFKANGYLEKSYLDKDGAKHITFEVSSKDSLEIAKLELMSRDLKKHSPILLEIYVKQTKENKGYKTITNKPQQRHYILRKSA